MPARIETEEDKAFLRVRVPSSPAIMLAAAVVSMTLAIGSLGAVYVSSSTHTQDQLADTSMRLTEIQTRLDLINDLESTLAERMTRVETVVNDMSQDLSKRTLLGIPPK